MYNIISKYSKIALALTMALGMASCSNGDWSFPDYEGGTTVYFSMQAPIRTITLGNDDDAVNTDDNAHQFKLQATMGGVYSNTKDRKISYQIDSSLMPEGTDMEVLPTSYYSMEDASTLTIPSGAIIGGTTVKLTDAFFNDAKAATTHYVLPVKMTGDATGDSILESKDYQLLCVKYKNQYTGLYCKTGTSSIDGVGTVTHANADDLWTVNTVDMNTCSADISFASGNNTVSFSITMVFAADGSCTVMQNGTQIGTGTFTARGIQDFSDVNRMADCLKLKFTATADVNGESKKLEADYTMSLMSRNNKLESWQ